MRRKDRELTAPEDILRILDTARILHLGLHDGDYPYVVPMNYGYEMADGKLTLYAHCAKEGHKLDCIKADPRVCVEIDCGEEQEPGDGVLPCSYGTYYACLIARGRAAVILDDEAAKVPGLKALMRCQTGKDFSFTEAMCKRVAVLRIDVDTYTAKARWKE